MPSPWGTMHVFVDAAMAEVVALKRTSKDRRGFMVKREKSVVEMLSSS